MVRSINMQICFHRRARKCITQQFANALRYAGGSCPFSSNISFRQEVSQNRNDIILPSQLDEEFLFHFFPRLQHAALLWVQISVLITHYIGSFSLLDEWFNLNLFNFDPLQKPSHAFVSVAQQN